LLQWGGMQRVVLLLLIVAACPDSLAAGERIGIVLADGRFASGEIDSRTDAKQLWVNASEQGVVLRSGFEWGKVDSVVHKSRQVRAVEFRKLVAGMERSSPALPEVILPASVEVPADRPNFGSIHPAVAFEPPPVASLRIHAWTANWDSDPELDGVLVEITPLGPYGEFVPTDGLVTMTLIGEYSQGHPEQLRRFRPRYPELAKTTVQVRAEHFDGGHAVYKLPYQNVRPEERLDLFPQGVVTATLGVPGNGNYTASTDAVSLIPASPIRDRRQQWTGRRYFPQELSRLR